MYALMHESIYCQGVAADWSAERVRAEFPEFDVEANVPFAFTGEMTYPWFFDEDAALVPLKEAADLLAQYRDWPDLFDLTQLAGNEVPVAAVVYHDDMFVDVHQSLDTAARVRNLCCWVTNEYEHDGLDSSPRVFDRLVATAAGDI